MHSNPRSDLGCRPTLPLQLQHLLMLMRATGEQLLPKVGGINHFARRVRIGSQAVEFELRDSVFAGRRPPGASHAIDQAIHRGFDQERPQLAGILEVPSRPSKSIPQVDPGRLHNVDGFELRPQAGRHPPSDDHPQQWFVRPKNLLNRSAVAAVQPLYNVAINGKRSHPINRLNPWAGKKAPLMAFRCTTGHACRMGSAASPGKKMGEPLPAATRRRSGHRAEVSSRPRGGFASPAVTGEVDDVLLEALRWETAGWRQA